jgi:hypothetical protein
VSRDQVARLAELDRVVNQARSDLRETLGHWKDGTRPGDNYITEGDVMHAISVLIAAVIDYSKAREAAEGT